MAGFRNVKDVVDAEETGQSVYFTFRKVPNVTGGVGVWVDTSLAAGNPSPQYYASTPLEAAVLSQSADGGIRHGGNVSPLKKAIKKFMIMSIGATSTPLDIIVGDILMYYPFIDEGDVSEQMLTNSVALSRYTDGDGVRIMCVSQSPRTGGATFTLNYTNQDGVAGRVTPAATMNTSGANGNIIHSALAILGTKGPFLELQQGDTGVRSVEGITMGTADVGLFAIVLFKPLFNTQLRGIDAPVEIDFVKDNILLPIVEDNAYLTMLVNPQTNILSQNYHGYIQTIWN
jgi:hypothetical protein